MNPIVEKVRKLLNLANDESASEGERDNALRMAHAFLKPAGSGFREGHEFGGKLSLNQQLGGSSQARIK